MDDENIELLRWRVVNDSALLPEHASLMTIDRTGDRIDLVSLKMEAFDIDIKDGWLRAKPNTHGIANVTGAQNREGQKRR